MANKIINKRKQVLLIGSGYINKYWEYDKTINKFKKEVWSADLKNISFSNLYSRISKIFTVVESNLQTIYNIKDNGKFIFDIYYPKDTRICYTFNILNYKGFTSDMEMLNQAINEEYDDIFLLGFNLISNQSNYFNQFNNLYNNNYKSRIFFLEKNRYFKNKLEITDEIQKKGNKNKSGVLKFNSSIFSLIDLLQEKYKNKDKLKILLLGNDDNIKSMPKELKLQDNVLIVGVNRIFYHLTPDLLFFMDCKIIDELINYKAKLNDSLWVTSDFCFNNPDMPCNIKKYEKFIQENNLYILPKPREPNIKKSSIVWIIHYLNNILLKNKELTFYLYGVSLNSNIDHFWKNKYKVDYNVKNKNILHGFFNSQLLGIQALFANNINLYSCTPNSRLNDFLPYKDFNQFLQENKI